jgi:hypothetical protein
MDSVLEYILSDARGLLPLCPFMPDSSLRRSPRPWVGNAYMFAGSTRVDEKGGMGKQLVKSYLLALILGWRSDGMDYFRDLVLFRLVAAPLQHGVVGPLSWYRVHGSLAVCRWRELVVSRILGRNQQPAMPGVLYPDSRPRALR